MEIGKDASKRNGTAPNPMCAMLRNTASSTAPAITATCAYPEEFGLDRLSREHQIPFARYDLEKRDLDNLKKSNLGT